MEPSVDVVNLVSSLLDSEKYKEALSVPVDEKYADSFKDNCWDLISAIIAKINNDTITLKPSLYGTCEQYLSIIVQSAIPEEALLEFIEQIEVSKNDAQFSIILEPLQQLLLKLTVKRGRSLEWCLNAICSYIDNIPIPEYQLEGKERILMECDDNIRRIAKVYSNLPPFYGPFVKEMSLCEANYKPKQIIISFLISLLGKPLIYVDVDPHCNKYSEARQCNSTIINDICVLNRNVLSFLDFIELCSVKTNKKANHDEDEEILPYQDTDKINMTTLSGLFYGIFSEHFQIPQTAVPLFYSPEYIVHNVLLCVIHLLSFAEYGPLSKGISLCKKILKLYPENVPALQLRLPVHYNLCQTLMSKAIFSTYESIRKESVLLMKIHINKFDYKGRCLLIKYVLGNANHSGMMGYAITLFKNSIDEAIKEPELPACFVDQQLYEMVKMICHLPHGAESDLVELADQIITSLNLLRYLAIKDSDNRTMIKNYFSQIESDYLEPLRVGLNMSKAHYEVKLKDIEEAKKQPKENIDIAINVGGNLLDKIPDRNKKEIIQSALNAFHLIEAFRIHGHKPTTPVVNILSINLPSINQTQNIVRKYCKVSDTKETPIGNTNAVDQDEHQYEEDVKKRILAKALEFVPVSGWSTESITQGSEAVGYPGITHGLFPNGGGDLVHYFNVTCNERLVEQMKTWPKEELKEPKVPAKLIENAIVTRLLMTDPYKNTWPKAMAIQALPNNVPNSLAALLSLVDDICYHTGDRSVDFNWYLRRVGLAGIYKASELFYLTDSSQDSSATKNFVKSRIRDAEFIQIAIKMNPIAVAPQTLTAAFVTAKNILGINTLK